MSLVNRFVASVVASRLRQIACYSSQASDIQTNVLFALLQFAKNTEYGRKYSFDKICSVEEFKQNVPVCEYNDIRQYIARMKKGEQNILWASPINWFAKSSGTTQDKSKFLPVSREALQTCHYQGGRDTLALLLKNNPDTKIFGGRSLILGGSSEPEALNTGAIVGDLSAIMIKNLPFYVRMLREPSLSTALLKDWDLKMQRIAEETINKDIREVVGVPSWMLVLFKKVLELTGKEKIIDVWKNLELFIHGGVSFVPYREQFEKIVGKPINYLETYNASEGFFGIQNDFSVRDMMLMLDLGVYYEFIPMSEIDKPNPRVLSIEETEIGVNYAMLITTNSGLWRYKIGDTICFTQKQPYKFVITGRIKHFINAFGEELIVDNAEKALKIACEKTGASIREYTAAPIYITEKSKGAHEWLIEFEKQPNNIEAFRSILDDELKSVNSDYEAKRYLNITLDTPQITIIHSGVFYEWMKSCGKLGGQHKVPRLENSRKYVDEILQFNVAKNN